MGKYMSFVKFILLFILFFRVCYCGDYENKLIYDLFHNPETSKHNSWERPVQNDSQPIVVFLHITIQQLIDIDEKNMLMISNGWLQVKWNNFRLRWNESEYGGVKSFCVPPETVWRPDILMYNSADEKFDPTQPTKVVVSSNGDMNYVPPGMFKSTCAIDISWFPFDMQACEMKFGSWAYSGAYLDLRALSDEGDISNIRQNGEWTMLGVPTKRHKIVYDCCPDEPYYDVVFTVKIRRKVLFYLSNMVLPGMVLSSLTLLSFVIPPDSGEKVSFGVTILLSLTVFSLLVSEMMPPTSDAMPLVGMYFSCIMMLCGTSVTCTVLILNLTYRGPETHTLTKFVRVGINEWLAWILRVKRPGVDLSRKNFLHRIRNRFRNNSPENITSFKPKNVKAHASKSLLANVLDIDDDLLLSQTTNCTTIGSVGTTVIANDNSTGFCQCENGVRSYSPVRCLQQCDGANRERSPPSPLKALKQMRETALTQNNVAQSNPALALILNELRFLTKRFADEDKQQAEKAEWKFCAHVLDRFFLVIFVVFNVVSTAGILLSAPNLHVFSHDD